MKTYHLRITGNEIVDINEDEYRLIEHDILARADKMIQAGGVVFSARDVRRVRSSWHTDVPDNYQQVVPEITDEMRTRNLRRMRWVKVYLSWQPFETLPPEERDGYQRFVDWYQSEAQIAKRAHRKAFRKEFFDVELRDVTEFDACFASWSAATDDQADPRAYHRSNHTPQALGLRDDQEELVKSVFGA